MKLLEKDINNGYDKIHEINKRERARVEFKKNTIFASVTGGALAIGAVATVLVSGPLGLALFPAYAAASPSLLGGLIAGGATGGGIGGAAIGTVVKKFIPRKWFGTETALSKTIDELKRSPRSRSDSSVIASDNTESPTSGIQMIPNTTSNNAAAPLMNTMIASDATTSTQANTSNHMETNATKTYEFTTPANRAEVSEFCNTYCAYNNFIDEFVATTTESIRRRLYLMRLRRNYSKME